MFDKRCVSDLLDQPIAGGDHWIDEIGKRTGGQHQVSVVARYVRSRQRCKPLRQTEALGVALRVGRPPRIRVRKPPIDRRTAHLAPLDRIPKDRPTRIVGQRLASHVKSMDPIRTRR